MRKLALVSPVLLLTLILAPRAHAQEASAAAKPAPEPVHYFHVDFVVQELGVDGKPTNSRAYTTTVSTDPVDGNVSIRTGSKMPIRTSDGQMGQAFQYQFIDVGVNIDARHAREVGHQLSLALTAEVSSMGAPAADPSLHQPTIRQNKWQAVVLIPFSKPTVIFTSDDLDSKGSMQVVATATPIQ